MNYLRDIYIKLQNRFHRSVSTKGVVSILFVLLAVILTVPGAVSCMPSMTKNLRDTSVQVWVDGYPEGSGIITGDGTEVLTILDYYMSPLPDDVYVVYDSDEKYEASIQRVDFRTGATLLKIAGSPLPVTKTGSALKLKEDDKVLVYGWSFPVKEYEDTEEGKKPVFGKAEFKKSTEAVVSIGITHTYPYFSIGYPERRSPEDLRFIGQSYIVTDEYGKVLGLAGNQMWGLIPTPVPVGSLPMVVSIDSMLELISEDADQRIWTKGPAGYSFIKPGGRHTAYGRAPSNYEAVAGEIFSLLDTLGEPMETDGLLDYYRPPFGIETGYGLVVVYASPIDIQLSGNYVINARWILLRWGEPEETNYVIYGMEPYEPEGAFEMTGDTHTLQTLLSSEL